MERELENRLIQTLVMKVRQYCALHQAAEFFGLLRAGRALPQGKRKFCSPNVEPQLDPVCSRSQSPKVGYVFYCALTSVK